MKKGLRQLQDFMIVSDMGLKPCPDEEGIKTRTEDTPSRSRSLKPCPDEEGIKTGLGLGLGLGL